MPEYARYKTLSDLDREVCKRTNKPLGFYLPKIVCFEYDSLDESTSQYIAETVWEKHGRPYYCIHPKLVDKLCGVDLSKIPSTLIEMPKPFYAILLRLREKNHILSVNDDYYVRSILVYRKYHGQTVHVKLSHYHTINFMQADDALEVWVDIGENIPTTITNVPVLVYRRFLIKDNEIIEKAISNLPTAPSANYGVPFDPQLLTNCVKLFVSVGFLAANADSVVEYDVLSKHKTIFQNTNDETERSKLIQEARKKGKIGWNIGTDEMFAYRPTVNVSSRANTGRSLQYAHIRRGHIHLYRCGPKRQSVKIKWISPLTVRNDLKFKPTDRG